jgi:uncharacterized membrane protein YbhN (UPF0104 family)
MSSIALAEHQYDILAALRRLDGKATVGDVVAGTGLPADAAETGMKALLESHRGHLAVSDTGELLYSFDNKLIERGTEPLLARLKRSAYRLFTKGFKVAIVATLVIYFVVFVALVIAALVANQSRGGGGGRRGGWGRGGGRGGLPIGDLWFWYWIWGPRWRLGRPYYGRRWERSLEKDDRVPFYKKVFAFVFGPDEPKATRQQLDLDTLRFIRARKGVLTTPELVQLTALPVPEAEQEMGRLLGSYGGEAVVSPDGELAYGFPGVMTSAHGKVRVREPAPAWMRLEYPKELTGNSGGANAAVVGINAFNLLAAATAPWFIFPRLGIGGPLAFVGLVVVPIVFSLLFFAVPGLRMLGVKRGNRIRARRNVRRVLHGLVYQDALKRGRGVTEEEAVAHVTRLLTGRSGTDREIRTELHTLAAEFDSDVVVGPNGETVYRFTRLRAEVAEGERMRQSMSLDEKRVGDIVYSTADSPAEAGARDLEAFDRELVKAATPADLGRLAPGADRVDYREDWEIVQ